MPACGAHRKQLGCACGQTLASYAKVGRGDNDMGETGLEREWHGDSPSNILSLGRACPLGGLLYHKARNVYRGQFAESRFEKNCLTEYAEVFKTVCVDAAYYSFPSETYLAGLAAQVPSDFRFTFKVMDDITLKHFPNLARFGRRAAQLNTHFLDADLF